MTIVFLDDEIVIRHSIFVCEKIKWIKDSKESDSSALKYLMTPYLDECVVQKKEKNVTMIMTITGRGN